MNGDTNVICKYPFLIVFTTYRFAIDYIADFCVIAELRKALKVIDMTCVISNTYFKYFLYTWMFAFYSSSAFIAATNTSFSSVFLTARRR